ncbi:hypothetical protein AXA84_0261 [Candidatus Phytoplasma oryzae]|uniref:Uncharacterized protein n=1 Tax=Candidatus Phytoplasma oryzae TaxID=203274 RepID=A0A139JQI8_9MOLU|nr:hypothetical protein [Candidatus Phytoplasma oryzae]KXT29232.1 hypothetical protein AXA84_0261 [Candidatus Phytoplasma oryzae]
MNLKINEIKKINYLSLLLFFVIFIFYFKKNNLLAMDKKENSKGKSLAETEIFTKNEYKELEEIFNNLSEENKEIFLKSLENSELYEFLQKKVEEEIKYLKEKASSSKKK